MRLRKAMAGARLLAALVVAVLAFLATPIRAWASASVSDPRVVPDGSMEAGQLTTWDCVWLGSYPQTYVDDAATVAALETATGWDADGDLSYGGATYRRLQESDANHSDDYTDEHWNWSSKASSSGYCYFLWEPVKWRVLEADGSTALVVADVALDHQLYNATIIDVTWEVSMVRSWLNGYGASSNQSEGDFTSRGFVDVAFSPSELGAVLTTDVENADNTNFGTTGGSDTNDRAFLLSESEVYNPSYGFVTSYAIRDEARRCGLSDYAQAMGVSRYIDGYCRWWLRSPGYRQNDACYVWESGDVKDSGGFTYYGSRAVRPALRLSLSSDQISYAGTVSSNGDVDEQAPGSSGGSSDSYDIANAEVTLVTYREDCSDFSEGALYVKSTTAYQADNGVPVGGPSVDSVVLDGRQLDGQDYECVYADYDGPGVARVTITGKGDYHGSKTVTYLIEEAGFLVGRDTNGFAHKNDEADSQGGKFTNPGFLGVSDYSMSKSYYADLIQNATKGEISRVKEEMVKKWDGSCYGLSVSMAKLQRGLMTASELCGYTVPTYWDFPWPSEESRFLDGIQYLQMSQYLFLNDVAVVSSSFNVSAQAFDVAIATSTGAPLLSLASLSYFAYENWMPLWKLAQDSRGVSTLENTLRAIVANRQAMILGFAWNTSGDPSGHTVLLTGHVVERDDGYHVDYYDVNSVDWGDLEVYTMRIDKDFNSFTIGDKATSSNYIYIRLVDPSKERHAFQGERLNVQTRKLKTSSDSTPATYLTLSLESPLLVEDVDHKALYWDGQDIWGDMEVLSADFVGEGPSTQLRVGVAKTGSVHVLSDKGSVDVSMYDEDDYVSLRASRLEEATLAPGSGVIAKVDSDFKAAISTKSEVVEGERGLVSFEGSTSGSVEVTANDKSASFVCNSATDGLKSSAYLGTEVEEGSLGDITADGRVTVDATDGSSFDKKHKAPSSISLAAQTKTYTGKALAYSGKVTKTGSTGKVTYAYYSDAKCTKAVKAADVKNAGTYYVRAALAADDSHDGATSVAAKFIIAKADNPLAAKGKTAKVKRSAVKKKARTLAVSKVAKITKAQGTKRFKVTKWTTSKAKKYIKVNAKTGKVTVKKGTPKGTYKFKLRVKAAGNANYEAGTKTVKVKVVVK